MAPTFANRHRTLLAFSTLAVFALLPAVHGQSEKNPAAPPLTDAQKRVQEAIIPAVQKAIGFLKATQNAQGTWGGGAHPVGFASLPGLAMLEAGVGPEDANVQKAALFVRNAAPQLDATYELALAILFLNRLGDAKDVPLIRSFALRLIAGQSAYGGWSYRCPILTAQEEQALLNFLQTNPPRFDPLAKVVAHPYLVALPKNMQALVDPQVKREKELGIDPTTKPAPLFDLLPNIIAKDPRSTSPSTYDPIKKESSNNPAPKPDPVAPAPDPAPTPKPTPEPKQVKPLKDDKGPFVPLRVYTSPKDPMAKTETPPAKDKDKDAKKNKVAKKDMKKPATTPNVGQWPSVAQFINQNLRPGNPQIAMLQQKDDNSNTQFAILGLWAARKYDVPMALTLVRLDRRFRSSQHADGAWSYHIDAMGALFPGGGIPDLKKGNFHAGTPSMTCVGLLGLGIGHGAFQEAVLAQKKSPTPPEFVFDPAIQKGLIALSRSVGPRANMRVNLYFLWSLERVCVMYHLPTLGGVDWHTWGATMLLANQNNLGAWTVGGYQGASDRTGAIDTSMAILFLSRANLNRDLSESLRRYVVVVDPAKVNP